MTVEEGLRQQVEAQIALIGEAVCPREDGTLCDACQEGREHECEFELKVKELGL